MFTRLEAAVLSAKVFALAIDYPFSHTQKAVMLALANQCDDFGGNCFPSFDLILRHSSLSRRAMFEAMSQLEEGGFISRLPLGNTQRVQFRIHVDKLQQSFLPGIGPQTASPQRARPTSAPAAPVQEAHQCDTRTGAQIAETGAPGALHKAPKSTPSLSGGRERALTTVELRKAVIAGGYPAIRVPTADPRLDMAAAEGAELGTQAVVALAQAVAIEAMGQSPPKSFGWIVGAIRGRIADALGASTTTTATVSRGTRGASNGPRRESDADRIARLGRALDEREAAAADG